MAQEKTAREFLESKLVDYDEDDSTKTIHEVLTGLRGEKVEIVPIEVNGRNKTAGARLIRRYIDGVCLNEELTDASAIRLIKYSHYLLHRDGESVLYSLKVEIERLPGN